MKKSDKLDVDYYLMLYVFNDDLRSAFDTGEIYKGLTSRERKIISKRIESLKRRWRMLAIEEILRRK